MAGLVVNPIESSYFDNLDTELRTLLDISGRATETRFEIRDDEFGTRWVILDDPDFEDLVSLIHTAAEDDYRTRIRRPPSRRRLPCRVPGTPGLLAVQLQAGTILPVHPHRKQGARLRRRNGPGRNNARREDTPGPPASNSGTPCGASRSDQRSLRILQQFHGKE